MIVIINGAPGTGKSKVAELLNGRVANSAWIDGDWMLRINPREGSVNERNLRYRQIANATRTYFEAGYKTIFISFVYMGPVGLTKQLDMLKKIDDVNIFALTASNNVLAKRHQTDSYKREGIEESIKINQKIKTLEDVEFIDTSDLAISDVAKIIESKL